MESAQAAFERSAKARLLLDTSPVSLVAALAETKDAWWDVDAVADLLMSVQAVGVWNTMKNVPATVSAAVRPFSEVIDIGEDELVARVMYRDALNAFVTKKVISTPELEGILQAMTINTPSLLKDPRARDKAYAKAFTMVRESDEVILGKVNKSLQKTIAEGMSATEAIQSINRIYRSAGISKQDPWYVELVHNNNTYRAHQEGVDAYAQDLAATGILWGYRWEHTPSKHERPTHVALDGFIAPKSDPRWGQLGDPPIAHNCRCRRWPVTQGQAEDEGLAMMPPTPTINRVDPDTLTAQKVSAISALDTEPGGRFGKVA